MSWLNYVPWSQTLDRFQKRNLLSTVASIVLEIGIQRKYSTVRVALRQPDHARIRERHRCVRIARKQCLHASCLFFEINGNF